MSANVNLLAFEDSVQAALAQTDDEEYGIQTRKLSLRMREPRGAGQPLITKRITPAPTSKCYRKL